MNLSRERTLYSTREFTLVFMNGINIKFHIGIELKPDIFLHLLYMNKSSSLDS